jgi:hypothetical protein
MALRRALPVLGIGTAADDVDVTVRPTWLAWLGGIRRKAHWRARLIDNLSHNTVEPCVSPVILGRRALRARSRAGDPARDQCEARMIMTPSAAFCAGSPTFVRQRLTSVVDDELFYSRAGIRRDLKNTFVCRARIKTPFVNQ